MSDEMNERKKILYSEFTSAWFELRREFAKQILSISTLSTAGVVAWAGEARKGGALPLFLSGLFFILAIAAGMIEMYLDTRLLMQVADPDFDETKTKWDVWVQGLSVASCVLVLLGAVCAGVFVIVRYHLLWEIY